MIFKTQTTTPGFWHRWFAWYPVLVEYQDDQKSHRQFKVWAWLEWVEREGSGVFGYTHRRIENAS